MAETGSLRLCLDECLGKHLPEVLRTLRAPAAPLIHGTRELGLNGVTDAVLMGELRDRGITALVTGDSRILAASIRRDAWRAASLTMFVMDGKWGNVSLFRRARGLIWWWPQIAAHASSGPQGAAWDVPFELREGAMARMFPDPI
jgi:PIN like domain